MFGPDTGAASIALPTRPLHLMYAEPAREYIERRGGAVHTGVTATVRVEGDAIDCVVTRSDWSEEKERFIVSCNYSKKSIAAADYEALVNDSDWTMKPLF